ncbi:MAG: UDP-N-acetylmuramoyl-L-alanine--D-glutamate ligase [Deltaproteobacteria bacterium]|nr:UDP-N-acetylmuramoyl-L-alanine--D-glutamate ligase [Deltaproteobacteria bacterium]
MKTPDLKGRRALVLGAGVSGRSAARFLLARGARVTVHDDGPRDALPADALALEPEGATLAAGGARVDPAAFDLAILSPGISVGAPRVRELRSAGVDVVGELELASWFLEAPIVAVTGTNGKTTVTTLLGRILEAQGRAVFVGGNVGTPLVEAVGGAWDVVVAEVSSFQLESIRAFRPKVGLFLNLTDDHFDRHGDLAGYGRAKVRLFENQGAGDAAIVNADDPAAWAAFRAAAPGSVLLPYSTERRLSVGAWAEGDDAVFLLPGRDGVRVPRGELLLAGRHNLGNALAACLAAAWVGADPRATWAEARTFRGLPHRVEAFLSWRGIRFVDDSKGTNVDAARRALETVEPPVVWVAGGVDKGGDYAPLAACLPGRVRRGVLVGASAARMTEALEGAAPLVTAADWPEAVRLVFDAAQPGDTVLLSPACSSFDFFTGYAARGDAFQRLCRDEAERRDRAAV